MTTNESVSQKKCCFYASDFHLEMTILPYINKKMEQDKDIVIITENNLEESIKILISKINIKNKEKILKIDWNNKGISRINKNAVIIINGTQNFIKDINEKIEVLKENKDSSIELVDCYLFDEIKDKMYEISTQYDGVINNLQKNTWKNILYGIYYNNTY